MARYHVERLDPREVIVRFRTSGEEKQAWYDHAGDREFSEWARRALNLVMEAERAGWHIGPPSGDQPTEVNELEADTLADLAAMLREWRARRRPAKK